MHTEKLKNNSNTAVANKNTYAFKDIGSGIKKQKLTRESYLK